MVVGVIGDDVDAVLDEGACYRTGVVDNALLVDFEARFECFFEIYCFCCDHVY